MATKTERANWLRFLMQVGLLAVSLVIRVTLICTILLFIAWITGASFPDPVRR